MFITFRIYVACVRSCTDDVNRFVRKREFVFVLFNFQVTLLLKEIKKRSA